MLITNILKRLTASITLLFALSVSVAHAAGVFEARLIACAQIRGDAERLVCFDQLARDTIASIETRPGPAAATVPTPAPSPAPSPDPKNPATDADEVEAAFGIERTEDYEKERVESISSRIVGEFTGWDGDTRFELENGQIWEQSDSSRAVYRANSPKVEITRGFFGSYRLAVEGLNRTCRVRRVK